MKVRISPTARQQLRQLTRWWNEHRPDARARVEDALAAIAAHPDAGLAYPPDPGYRTWRLAGTPYVLFYRRDSASETTWVMAAWSAARGAGPELP